MTWHTHVYVCLCICVCIHMKLKQKFHEIIPLLCAKQPEILYLIFKILISTY